MESISVKAKLRLFVLIWVLAGNRWFIQTTEESLPKQVFAEICTGLRKAAGGGAEPQGWHHWGTVSTPRPRGVQRRSRNPETELHYRRGAKTGAMSTEGVAPAS